MVLMNSSMSYLSTHMIVIKILIYFMSYLYMNDQVHHYRGNDWYIVFLFF